jgi:hypothetical protein
VLLLVIVYLMTPFQYLRQSSVDVGGKPAASAHFLPNPDLSAEPEPSSSEAGETCVRNMAAEFCIQSICFMLLRFFHTL